nr:MAG: RNA-dependent RNA polymerase [Riboviria sp.]
MSRGFSRWIVVAVVRPKRHSALEWSRIRIPRAVITRRTDEMTTPAVDERDLGLAIPSYIQMWDGTTGSLGPVTSSVFIRKRPKSVKSPIRSDRTRAPRGWSSSGLSDSLPFAETQWSQDPAGKYMTRYNSGRIPYQGVAYINGVNITFPANLAKKADCQALDNAKRQKVNLGVALAEARQTARLVGQTAEKIGKMVNLYRSKNPKKIWDAVKRGGRAIPSSYLEMSYGWSPLLQDVLGSAEALAEAQNLGRRFSVVVKGAATDTSRHFYRKEWAGLYDLVYEGEIRHRCETVLRYDLPANMLDSLSSLGLTNPLAIQWELVPFSFVVDWFFPIGDYVNRLDAGSYLSFIEGSRSMMSRINSRSRYEDRNETSYRYNKVTTTRTPGRFRAWQFNRTVLSQPPSVPLPDLRSPLSLDKMAKGLSLLAMAFQRNPGKWGNRNIKDLLPKLPDYDYTD